MSCLSRCSLTAPPSHNRVETIIEKAIQTDPVQVAQQKHEGSDYVVIYQGGSTVRIKRMHAEN